MLFARDDTVSTNLRAPCLILALSLAAAPAAAQREGAAPSPDSAGLPDWVEADPFAGGEHDPLGAGRGDGLEATVPTDATEEARASAPIQRGEVLTAVAGVREASHDVDVRLAHGLAIVDVTMRFTSSARHAAELDYRLAVPDPASLAELEVCNARGCRRGLIDPSAGELSPYDEAVRSHGEGGLPIAHAASVEDARGHAIRIRAAPVQREGRLRRGSQARTPPGDGPLTVKVRYAIAAPIRGGRVRLAMPERGHDTRAAPARIRIRSDELSTARVDELDAVESAVERPPGQPWEISARLIGAPDVLLEAHRTRCDDAHCVRLRAVAAPREGPARDVFLLLDASPSTHGPARGRMGPTIATLLGALPAGARVRAVVFAARAETVVDAPVPASEISLGLLTRSLERELGSATRFEAAWPLIERSVTRAQRPLVIVLGDGGLTTGADSRRALARARAAGAELASINVADRATSEGLRSAVDLAVEAGPQADRAARGRLGALEEVLAPLTAPVVVPHVRVRVGSIRADLGALRAGEERTWEGILSRGAASITANRTARAAIAPDELGIVVRDRAARAAGRPGVRLAAITPESLADEASCGGGPRRSASAPVGRDVHLVLSEPRRCAPPPRAPAANVSEGAPADGRIARIARHEGQSSLPARSLLDMLRQRIVPVARRCFREDRRGRPNYQTRAIFEFRLADREVVDAEVTGRLTPELRACLLSAIDALEIPRFDGTIAVRYPIYTAPELPPPTLTLDTDVADAVDALTEP